MKIDHFGGYQPNTRRHVSDVGIRDWCIHGSSVSVHFLPFRATKRILIITHQRSTINDRRQRVRVKITYLFIRLAQIVFSLMSCRLGHYLETQKSDPVISVLSWKRCSAPDKRDKSSSNIMLMSMKRWMVVVLFVVDSPRAPMLSQWSDVICHPPSSDTPRPLKQSALWLTGKTKVRVRQCQRLRQRRQLARKLQKPRHYPRSCRKEQNV